MGLSSYIFGVKSEEKAKKFLEKMSFEILDTNFHSKFGEIDIIAKDKNDVLHFIEVKATSGDYEPLERINKQKYNKILKSIEFYIFKMKFTNFYQIDALIIKNNNIEFIENLSI